MGKTLNLQVNSVSQLSSVGVFIDIKVLSLKVVLPVKSFTVTTLLKVDGDFSAAGVYIHREIQCSINVFSFSATFYCMHVIV